MSVYLDYNATSPPDPRVLEAMRPCWEEGFANPSSLHRAGQRARHAVDEARETLAECLRVEPRDLLWTSGGTEADNLALLGAAESAGPARDHLVVSSIEHPAVLGPARALEARGLRVTFVRTRPDGIVDPEDLARSITERTALVSLMHVNNELGTIQPVEEAARLAHDKGALLHVDAVQSFGKLEVHPEEMGADLVSLSAHKICGPKGAGALYARKGIRLKPVLHGGHQERNIRPGTENVAAIVGFAAAARICLAEREEENRRVCGLRDKLENGLVSALTGVRLNGDRRMRAPGTASVTFEGLDGETVLINLDLSGICASTGSACTSGSIEPSHVLLALGLDENLARGTIRFSVGRFTTGEEIDFVLRTVPPLIRRLRETSTAAGRPNR